MMPPFPGGRVSVEHYRALAREVLRDRKVILAIGMVAGSGGWVKLLREMDARLPALLLAEGIGTGALPPPEDLSWVVVGDDDAPDMMSGIRSYDRGLRSLSAEAREAIERFDPAGEALVIAAFISDVVELAGRRRYAPRLEAWYQLEDKVNIEAFWDRHGVPRAPSRVVPARRAALLDAASALDQGLGTCWAGDNREGFNGGASYLRWIAGPAHVDEAAAFFEARCDRVRVMPFLEGIPCSIHGVVFPETVIALRPCEMVVMRRPGASTLLYAGAASSWDPHPDDREAMRSLAKRVGACLRDEVGYRGAFTIDGIMTAEGFRPTELNARYGAALSMLAAGLPELPLYLLCEMVREGEDFDFRPEALERLMLEAADANRGGGGWSVVPGPKQTDTVRHRLVREDGAWRFADDDEPHHANLSFGPSAVGGFLRFSPLPEHIEVGRPMVDRVVEVYGFADRVLGTGFGPLEGARDVRAEAWAADGGPAPG